MHKEKENTLWQTQWNTQKKLMATAILGYKFLKTEEEIRETEKECRTLIVNLANELHPDWTKHITLHEPTYKLQAGTNKHRSAENHKDILQGCINRMHVTHEQKEFERCTQSAIHHIHALTQLALDRVGAIKLAEYDWRTAKLTL